MLARIIVTCLLLCNASFAHARWATFADAPVEVIANNMQITVNADGTAEILSTKQIKVLNERGREANSKIPLLYNFDNSKLEILQARTIVDGKTYDLSANLIEDKPLASAVQGFDQTHQVLLAFPNVKVGAIISLQYKLSLFKPDIPDFFEYMAEFVDNYTRSAEVHITSALPLFVNMNDPHNYLSIKPGKNGKLYTLGIKLLKPIYISVVDEQKPLINPNKYPWVFVATEDNWTQFAAQFADPYIEVLKQPLPEMYQQIVDTAQKEKDPIQKIAIVAALLNEHIQYMGDWQTANGRHIPQNLADVTAKRLGDCKDFATDMVAILQRLGIKANVALVTRGMAVYDTNMVHLPGAFHFNHAMVRVEVGTKVLWVDPTNFFSIADKILPDIADRQVLVLDAKNSHLEHIPQSNPADNEITVNKALNLKNVDLVDIKTKFTLSGLSAINYTGAGLQVAKETIDNAVIYQLGDFDNIVEKKVITPNLNSRVVADLTFDVAYKERNMVINTNAGYALQLQNPSLENFVFNTDLVSDIYLGPPKILHNTITLNNIHVTSKLPLDHSIKSPWVDVIRTVKYNKDNVVVDQKVIIKTSWLYNETLKSKEYQSFEAELAKNFKDGVAIVFNN